MGLAAALAATSLAETVVDSHYWFAMCRLELRTKVRVDLHALAILGMILFL